MRNSEPGSTSIQDTVQVHFRPVADREFRRRFSDEERDALLLVLVEAVESAEALEQGNGPRLKRLTLFGTRFGTRFDFVDLRECGQLLVEAVTDEQPDPPPPKNPSGESLAKIALKVTAGGVVSGVVRWALEQIKNESSGHPVLVGQPASRALHLEIKLGALGVSYPNPAHEAPELLDLYGSRPLSSNVRTNPSIKRRANPSVSQLVSSNVRRHWLVCPS